MRLLLMVSVPFMAMPPPIFSPGPPLAMFPCTMVPVIVIRAGAERRPDLVSRRAGRRPDLPQRSGAHQVAAPGARLRSADLLPPLAAPRTAFAVYVVVGRCRSGAGHRSPRAG